MSELEGEGGEDVVEVPAVLEIAGAEEGRSKSPVSEDALGDGLGDRGFASPGKPVEPVDGGHFGVRRPRLYGIQHSLPGPFEAALTVTVSKFDSFGAVAAVQDGQFTC